MRQDQRSPRTVAQRGALTVITVLALLAWASVPAVAAAPQEAVRQLITSVSAVVDDPALQGSASKVERQRHIGGIIHDAFEYQEMARHSLGAQWGTLTPPQRQEFTRLFADLFERSYSVLVVRFLGGRTTTYAGESIDGDRAVVRTRLLSEQDGEMPVEYRLAASGGRWAVVDVVVDGVSLVANYRVQFAKIIRSSSYETLLQRMRKRVE